MYFPYEISYLSGPTPVAVDCFMRTRNQGQIDWPQAKPRRGYLFVEKRVRIGMSAVGTKHIIPT